MAIAMPARRSSTRALLQSLTDGTQYAQARSVAISGSDVFAAGYDGNVAKVWKFAADFVDSRVTTTPLTNGNTKAIAYSVFVNVP